MTPLIFDGETPYGYTSNKMVSGFFDLEWEYVEAAGGATVHPGNPKIPDINKWEEYVSIPDLNAWRYASPVRTGLFMNAENTISHHIAP